MDLRRYRNLLRRWWWLPALATLVGAAIGFLLSATTPRVYKASTHLFINQVQTPGQPGLGDVSLSQGTAGFYGQLVRSRPFLQEAVKQLDLPLIDGNLGETAGALVKKIVVKPEGGTQYLVLTVADSDPARAAAIANALPGLLIQRTQDLTSRQRRPGAPGD